MKQVIKHNEIFEFCFANPMPDGPIRIMYDPDDGQLEIELRCGAPRTANRLYIEKTDAGFTVVSHNHNSPGAPQAEREVNCEF